MTRHSQSDRDATAGVVPDRRRPGRPRYVSPQLLPLLRRSSLENVNEAELDATAAYQRKTFEVEENPDNLSAARGVAISAGLGILFWALLFWAAWPLFSG